ncbi:single-stranded DNA-binding protein [Bythopirellula goksoeyrii]|uniref:Single-stranded DNA-binding protein n=1 Tax=Bythopirellula goksoeyrii TaxID=1400387 RepID=A0A5B9QP71_9BACT|nr:single-stranded DNA-binding protein [Bythopirellula goksoeyrii]QEG35911.1 Single-stranded DNA-binding protein [Bythopirellula goksoeyrii]
MSSFNQVVLMGNLVRSPELRYLPGGEKAVCEVPIAVNERFKRGDEMVESVSFIDVTFWGRTAEIVNEYLVKGSPILIQGRLKQDTWEKDGEKRSKLKVVCEQMKMIGGKKSDDQSATEESQELVAAATDDSF